MEKKIKEVSLYNLLKSFSAAMDLVSSELVGHHRQVAYISYMIGREMEFSVKQLKKLVIAALIHDVGIFYLNQTFDDLNFDNKDSMHAEVGYQLIKEYFPLDGISEIIKYHHREWSQEVEGCKETLELAGILFLADRVVTLIDSRNVLSRRNFIRGKIAENSGTMFWPTAVQAFLDISVREYFWLNSINSWQISRTLDKNSYLYDGKLNMDDLIRFSEITSHIIDFRSPFTATHSNGVAVLAERMGSYFDFDSEECKMLKIAGFFHDIGKLAVPVEILNKTGALTNKEWSIMRSHSYYTFCVLDESDELTTIKEWASFHHERLRGDGYPFHLNEEDLSTGARIVAVVDVFTSITEDRPYRKGMGKEQVLDILNDMIKNNILDKRIVKILIDNYSCFDLLRIKSQGKARRYYRDFKDLIESKKNTYKILGFVEN